VDEQLRGEFEAWYRALHPRLVTTLVAVLGDVDVARDAADEAFARAFERWSRVSRMESMDGWTYRVAYNFARRHWRRRALERRLLRAKASEASVPGPAGELWLLVSELPRRQALAVSLRHVGQLTEQEVADVMGVKRDTVSATLRAAYERLRVRVGDDVGEPNHA
jgi:DNA-directed RNA polymerase specialized sigma24 family protein